jgi:hypothetical protein
VRAWVPPPAGRQDLSSDRGRESAGRTAIRRGSRTSVVASTQRRGPSSRPPSASGEAIASAGAGSECAPLPWCRRHAVSISRGVHPLPYEWTVKRCQDCTVQQSNDHPGPKATLLVLVCAGPAHDATDLFSCRCHAARHTTSREGPAHCASPLRVSPSRLASSWARRHRRRMALWEWCQVLRRGLWRHGWRGCAGGRDGWPGPPRLAGCAAAYSVGRAYSRDRLGTGLRCHMPAGLGVACGRSGWG